MIARFTSSRSSVDLNAATLFPIKMAAHVVTGLRNEAVFYAINLQGKTVPSMAVYGLRARLGEGELSSVLSWNTAGRIGGRYDTPGNRSVLLVCVRIRQSLN